MWRWLKGYLRLGGYKHRAAALKKQDVLQLKAAERAGFFLMDGLLNRKNICKRCYNIYVPKDYEFGERFMVRSILRIPDSEPDPMLCDFCFNSIMQETNQQWTNIGTSNSGPPNLILRRSIEKT